MTNPHVVIVSNDVIPGSGMPVAAPGLRAYGLAQGLKAHGDQAEIVVVSAPVDRQWQGDMPPPTTPGAMVLPTETLPDYLDSRRPVVVVITNSNQIDHIPEGPDVSVVLDFFAPKMLELTYRDDELDIEAFRFLRERKKRAIERADAYIVNGHKKVPYFLAWIIQADRDLRTTELGVVPMGVPSKFIDKEPSGPVKLVNAGYLQGWSQHGKWMDVLRQVLDNGGFELHALTPPHWGRPVDLVSEVAEELGAHPAVRTYDALRFEDFQDFLARADVSVDLFDWSWEREYAMVTRTVVALACGVPVIHPPFTEVSPIIAEYDAGWLVDPDDEQGFESTLKSLVNDPGEIARKAANARA
ncbi:MAG: hypothetical protein WB239_10025, partial [Acidimicrobiia bacterium]